MHGIKEAVASSNPQTAVPKNINTAQIMCCGQMRPELRIWGRPAIATFIKKIQTACRVKRPHPL